MKTEEIEVVLAKVNQLRAAIEAAREKFLLAGGGVCFMDDGPDGIGGIDDEAATPESGIQMDIGRWPEHTRTMTERGRAELCREENAEIAILRLAEWLGFAVLDEGRGNGEGCEINCYRLKMSPEARGGGIVAAILFYTPGKKGLW